MKLRNKETGKVQTCDMVVITDEKIDGEIASLNKHTFIFRSIEQFNEQYEGYKPAEHIFDDEKVSKAIRAWLSVQVQPIEAVSIRCSKDSDGFFSYHLYGYIAKARIVDGKAVVNNNLLAIHFYFRSDVYFEHKSGHDYSVAELIGEEAEWRS